MRKFCLSALAAAAAVSLPANALGRQDEGRAARARPRHKAASSAATPRSRTASPASDKRFDPDKVIAYATQEPKQDGDEIKTRGGAFRSKGEWYHVAYKCVTAPDHIAVLSLR